MVSYMLSVCLMTMLLALGTPFEQGTPSVPSVLTPERVVDEVFVAQATRNARAEIAVSKLALTKSERPDVKMVAQRVVDDHTKMKTELAAIANAKKMLLPNEPTPRDKATLDELEKLMGDDFDRTYITQVIADHERSIETFREYSENGADAVLKAWAMKTVASLQLHLDNAREVEKKLGS